MKGTEKQIVWATDIAQIVKEVAEDEYEVAGYTFARETVFER